MGITVAVLSGYLLALAAPWGYRLARGAAGPVFALLPLGIALYSAVLLLGPVRSGQTLEVAYSWVPSLGVIFAFYADGLSLLFALLISGVGALIVIYTGGYLAGHPNLGRFYAFLLLFMASMLGLVLAGNLLTLYLFWELTSISSFLLIGFDHEREAARSAALQALLVTTGGGLALLAGLLLLGQAGGSLELPRLLQQGEAVRAHALYLPALLLILVGAFTKSAQFPFHFWLPSAMEAPTPVSAYLHSATMVKAGVYLLARLSPILGGTPAWSALVTAFGAATMLAGGLLALTQTDLKRILAYSTISALGLLVLMLGLGTPAAVTAAMVFLLAHAPYKGALFMVAGAVDHATGTRDVERLGGLRRAMPITASAALLAAISLAGLGPVLSFIGKEMLLEAVWEAPEARLLWTVAVVAAGALFVAVALIAGLRPFLGPPRQALQQAHEGPASLWMGAALLALLGPVLGMLPGTVGENLVAPSVRAVLGRPEPVSLGLWHGFNLPLVLSIVSVAVGLGIYAAWGTFRRIVSRCEKILSWGPDRLYGLALVGLNALARGQTRLLQNGYLRSYLLVIIVTTVALVAYTLGSRGGGPRWLDVLPPTAGAPFPGLEDVRFHEAALAGLILLAALVAVFTRSRLAAVAALGVSGYGLALVYILFGAADLAMTQFLVDTLTVVLFVLVFHHLPLLVRRSKTPARIRDGLVALAAGTLMTALVLAAGAARTPSPLAAYFAEHSLPAAHGRNIVNVILVDFRSLDTLGEITVLAVAGAGVYALLKLRGGKGPAV